MDRKKYIVEASDDVKKVIAIGVTRGGAIWTDTTDIENLEELNSDYINENFGGLQDEAYQRGLDDAWETAKKLSWTEKHGGYGECLDKVFDRTDTFDFLDYSPNAAIEKLKAYEDKHSDRIEVGDEVTFLPNDRRGIVTACHVPDVYAENDKYAVFCGTTVEYVLRQHITKTGKHYDIQSILEAMRK